MSAPFAARSIKTIERMAKERSQVSVLNWYPPCEVWGMECTTESSKKQQHMCHHQASFPVREMTYFLDGGKGMTELKVSQ